MQLFTVGYEGWEPSAFLDCLAAYGIECIIDVRENPLSRKPGFSKGTLSRALKAAAIQYVNVKELGAVFEGVLEAVSRVDRTGRQDLVGDPGLFAGLHGLDGPVWVDTPHVVVFGQVERALLLVGRG